MVKYGMCFCIASVSFAGWRHEWLVVYSSLSTEGSEWHVKLRMSTMTWHKTPSQRCLYLQATVQFGVPYFVSPKEESLHHLGYTRRNIYIYIVYVLSFMMPPTFPVACQQWGRTPRYKPNTTSLVAAGEPWWGYMGSRGATYGESSNVIRSCFRVYRWQNPQEILFNRLMESLLFCLKRFSSSSRK